MGKIIRLRLSEDQRAELETVRDQGSPAHLREKAAALLKVASGELVQNVAWHGLLKRRDPETVSRWVRRYEQDGLTGLQVQQGRGRKSAFFPASAQPRPKRSK